MQRDAPDLGSVKKALVDVSRRVKDALDSNFVGGFVNRMKNQVAPKRRNPDTGPKVFPQRRTFRRVQNQETAGADFCNETERPPWIVAGDCRGRCSRRFPQGRVRPKGKSGNASGLRHGLVLGAQAVKDLFRWNAGAAVDARLNLLPQLLKLDLA